MEENKGLRLVFGLAIGKRDIVVGNLTDSTFIYTRGSGLDNYELAFVPAKQVLRVLSCHFILPNHALE
jgi:hypothetical protein